MSYVRANFLCSIIGVAAGLELNFVISGSTAIPKPVTKNSRSEKIMSDSIKTLVDSENQLVQVKPHDDHASRQLEAVKENEFLVYALTGGTYKLASRIPIPSPHGVQKYLASIAFVDTYGTQLSNPRFQLIITTVKLDLDNVTLDRFVKKDPAFGAAYTIDVDSSSYEPVVKVQGDWQLDIGLLASHWAINFKPVFIKCDDAITWEVDENHRVDINGKLITWDSTLTTSVSYVDSQAVSRNLKLDLNPPKTPSDWKCNDQAGTTHETSVIWDLGDSLFLTAQLLGDSEVTLSVSGDRARSL